MSPELRSCIVCGEHKTLLSKEIQRAERRRARLLEPKNLAEIERLKGEILRCEHTHYASRKGATA